MANYAGKIIEITNDGDSYEFSSPINHALSEAQKEVSMLRETMESVEKLKNECDALDYILATSSGMLCGLMDIFLVGSPKDTFLGGATDKWAQNCVKQFAKSNGWSGAQSGDVSSAIRFLEKKYKVPYDQRGMGDAGSAVFGLNANNHHFRSLAHNPSLLGLFFSILDQFNNTSHFVSKGDIVALVNASDSFALAGGSVPAKIFSGIMNWIGHLMSDFSGASGSVGRGMGIPSPLWTWINDFIVILRQLNITPPEFLVYYNKIAEGIYMDGFDSRYQGTQAIPVIINELVVRGFYTIRRSIRYFKSTPNDLRNFKDFWKQCAPFHNPTVHRMLTIAHASFVTVDLADAIFRGVTKGGVMLQYELILRVNVVGVCRLGISLGSEVADVFRYNKAKGEADFARRELIIVEDYIKGLKELAKLYDDRHLMTFVDDLKTSDLYKVAFAKTVELAELRKVPEDKILRTMDDIDVYFKKGE